MSGSKNLSCCCSATLLCRAAAAARAQGGLVGRPAPLAGRHAASCCCSCSAPHLRLGGAPLPAQCPWTPHWACRPAAPPVVSVQQACGTNSNTQLPVSSRGCINLRSQSGSQTRHVLRSLFWWFRQAGFGHLDAAGGPTARLLPPVPTPTGDTQPAAHTPLLPPGPSAGHQSGRLQHLQPALP